MSFRDQVYGAVKARLEPLRGHKADSHAVVSEMTRYVMDLLGSPAVRKQYEEDKKNGAARTPP